MGFVIRSGVQGLACADQTLPHELSEGVRAPPEEERACAFGVDVCTVQELEAVYL